MYFFCPGTMGQAQNVATKAEILQEGIFSASIYLHEKFYYKKSWKSKKLRPPSIQV